jgi:acyl-coenzyme A synthetase/AMP-(fatty) acid ligase
MNVVEPFLHQCRQNPPAAALCAPGTTLNVVSYARLERFINNIGRRALAAGLFPGGTVAIMIKDYILHAATALALARIGIATLSVADLRLPPGLRVDAVMTDVRPPVGTLTVPPMIFADLGWTEGNGEPPEERFVAPGGGGVARIVLTSGSTGQPKAIALTHRMSLRRAARFAWVFGVRFAECSRCFTDMGLGSAMSFLLLVHVLSRGGTFFFPGATPMDSVQTFNLYGVQGMLASPGGLSAILKFYDENPAFHSEFHCILSAGSLLRRPLSERVRARLCSNLVVLYGTSETAMVATAPAHAVAETPGAAGYVIPGVGVEIVDAEHRLVMPGAEGSLRISGVTNVDEYMGDPQQTSASFRDGCFYPGDVGRLEGGLLVISGRDNDVLNLGGDKMRPEAVEDILAAFDAVDQAAVFGMPNSLGVDELWALIVPRAPLDEKQLRAHCEQRLPPACWPAQIITVERLPRNDTGKIERHRLKELALARG